MAAGPESARQSASRLWWRQAISAQRDRSRIHCRHSSGRCERSCADARGRAIPQGQSAGRSPAMVARARSSAISALASSRPCPHCGGLLKKSYTAAPSPSQRSAASRRRLARMALQVQNVHRRCNRSFPTPPNTGGRPTCCAAQASEGRYFQNISKAPLHIGHH